MNLMKKGVDKEWVQLISEAKKIGITVDEIRGFLQQTPAIKNGDIKGRSL